MTVQELIDELQKLNDSHLTYETPTHKHYRFDFPTLGPVDLMVNNDPSLVVATIYKVQG